MKKVIIIDDDVEDIEIMKESIGGHECDTFVDACEALEYLKAQESVPDLIVIDINMPKVSGQECLSEIRKISKLHTTLVAIYSSAIPHEDVIQSFVKAGAVFFQKPSSYEELNRVFQNLIEESLKRKSPGTEG